MTYIFETGDLSCDPEYTYAANTEWTIQDCRSYGGGFVVNRCYEEVPGDEDSFCVEEFGVYKTLEAAKASLERLVNASG